jgi:hypothetical protein
MGILRNIPIEYFAIRSFEKEPESDAAVELQLG